MTDTPLIGDIISSRVVLAITGADRHHFLGGLISNAFDADTKGGRYAALLSPQGKYLADFFVVNEGDTILLDAHADQAADLARRLSMYKLRADVAVAATKRKVVCGLGDTPAIAWPDPRDPALGWRAIVDAYAPASAAGIDWAALSVAHLVPQSGADLVPSESYILEMGFERLAGVDFKKGCYVGQEVTARMKHKTQLRKGLTRVGLSAPVEPGTKIMRDGKEVGMVGSVAGNSALAFVRFDRQGPGATAGPADVTFETAAPTD